jgi:hypothetical protein
MVAASVISFVMWKELLLGLWIRGLFYLYMFINNLQEEIPTLSCG